MRTRWHPVTTHYIVGVLAFLLGLLWGYILG